MPSLDDIRDRFAAARSCERVCVRCRGPVEGDDELCAKHFPDPACRKCGSLDVAVQDEAEQFGPRRFPAGTKTCRRCNYIETPNSSSLTEDDEDDGRVPF